mgnify:CR=1 FL=1
MNQHKQDVINELIEKVIDRLNIDDLIEREKFRLSQVYKDCDLECLEEDLRSLNEDL